MCVTAPPPGGGGGEGGCKNQARSPKKGLMPREEKREGKKGKKGGKGKADN